MQSRENSAQARQPFPGLTRPRAAGGTRPVLTVFQATKSSCPGLESQSSAATIAAAAATAAAATPSASITVHKTDPPSVAHGDDASAGLWRSRDVCVSARCGGSAQARAWLCWRRLRLPDAVPTMTQQGAALQNYNNELVKCERRVLRAGDRPTHSGGCVDTPHEPRSAACPSVVLVGDRSSRAPTYSSLSSRPP